MAAQVFSCRLHSQSAALFCVRWIPTLCAACIAGHCVYAHAALHYRSINTTYSIPFSGAPIVPLDWNNDGVADLRMRLSYGALATGGVAAVSVSLLDAIDASALDASFLIDSRAPTPNAPAALAAGAVIGSTSAFSSDYEKVLFVGVYDQVLQPGSPSSPGNFLVTNSIRYFGVQFSANGNHNFGWASLRFSLPPIPAELASVYVGGLAFEDSGALILSGQFADFSPADFNDDGAVNAADLTAWTNQFGELGTADADGDGDTDGADLLAWQVGLGTRSIPVQASSQAIPEPHATGVLTAGAILLATRRRAAPYKIDRSA